MYTTTLPASASTAPVRSQSRKEALLFVGIAAIPVILSFLFFMNQSLRLDEAQSLWQTSRSVSDTVTMVAGDVHVPLYHLILHFWRMMVGDTVSAARFLSLIFFVLSIPALYMIGARAYNRRVALFASFLFAISPFMNWYANEARMYTLFTLLVILNQYCFLRILKHTDSDHVWAGYLGTALLGTFTHYFFFLNFAAQVFFYAIRRELFPPYALKRFILAGAVVGALFLPWAWYVAHVGTVGFEQPNLLPPTTVNLFSSFSQFLFGFQDDNINTIFLSLWPVSVALALFSLRRRKMEPQTEYFIITVLLSLCIPFFVSLVWRPLFVTRYLIFTIPSLYLLLASALHTYSPRIRRITRGILATVMIGMLFLEIFSPTTPVRENYAQAADYLNAHATPSDAVVLSAPFTIYPVEYYYRGVAPLQTLPVWNQYEYGAIPAFDAGTLPAQAAQVTNANQNLYLLLSYDQGYEKTIKDYFDSHFQRIDEETFSHDLTLYVYKLRYDTGGVVLPVLPHSSVSAATSTQSIAPAPTLLPPSAKPAPSPSSGSTSPATTSDSKAP